MGKRPGEKTDEHTESRAIDFAGKSHWLAGRIISPGQTIRLVFPPLLEANVSGNESVNSSPLPGSNDSPGYIAPKGYGEGNSDSEVEDADWDWPTGTEMTVHLVFRQQSADGSLTLFDRTLDFRRTAK
jgi:hypothetical protein